MNAFHAPAIGTFQGYYEVVLLKDYSASSVAWIPSLQIFFSYLTVSAREGSNNAELQTDTRE